MTRLREQIVQASELLEDKTGQQRLLKQTLAAERNARTGLEQELSETQEKLRTLHREYRTLEERLVESQARVIQQQKRIEECGAMNRKLAADVERLSARAAVQFEDLTPRYNKKTEVAAEMKISATGPSTLFVEALVKALRAAKAKILGKKKGSCKSPVAAGVTDCSRAKGEAK